MSERQPMTPAEFDAACRALLRRHPALSCTSGGRSAAHNARVNGEPLSKHLIDMARDYVGPVGEMQNAAGTARVLGLWYVLHDVGSGKHLHVQGLAPGEIPDWWRKKYLEE